MSPLPHACRGRSPDGATAFKCSLRARSEQPRTALGRLRKCDRLIVSDHSPCTVAMKESQLGIRRRMGGISSLQLSLSIVWTEARRRNHPLAQVAGWMAERPAKLAGLRQKERSLPDSMRTSAFWLRTSRSMSIPIVYHRNPLTPYAGGG